MLDSCGCDLRQRPPLLIGVGRNAIRCYSNIYIVRQRGMAPRRRLSPLTGERGTMAEGRR